MISKLHGTERHHNTQNIKSKIEICLLKIVVAKHDIYIKILAHNQIYEVYIKNILCMLK